MTVLGLAGLVVGGFIALVGVLLIALEIAVCVMEWRERRAHERAGTSAEAARRQERAAVAAVVRPHGRRVVAGLSCEKRPVVTRRRAAGGG